jgi:Glycoside hydrolase 123 N-terminal domain/Glycoside hydrolase 123, catalytic domain
VDDDSNVIDQNPSAGFYLVPVSEVLIGEALTGREQTIEIPTEAGAYYLVTFENKGAGNPPTTKYEQTFPLGSKDRSNQYLSSYMPRLLPRKKMAHECLLLSDGDTMALTVKDGFVTGLKSISVKKVKIVFLADIKKPGKKQWMLYYQPNNGYHLVVPELRHSKSPGLSAKVRRIGLGEKYLGNTRYSLGSNDFFSVWFAETTVKLTPNTPAPQQSSTGIKITCAKNEKQSFQLVLNPKQAFTFKKIRSTSLNSGPHRISSSKFNFYAIDYVPITKRSMLTPVRYRGLVADPLVAVEQKKIMAVDGNFVLWTTLNVPADAVAGTYNGVIIIGGKGKSSMRIPLEVEVYDFELPEFSRLQTCMGGQYFAKRAKDEGKTLMDYHGLKSWRELKKLSGKYYDVMAINKFCPKTVGLYAEIGMNWSPPPKGYNVNSPENFFKLYDWDFSEFNKVLEHYIDGLNVNNITIYHTNPTVCNSFMHLPGDELAELFLSPGHGTMAWQNFREHTCVGYDLKQGEGYGDETIEITEKQYDRLLMDYLRTIAKNLDDHGWLDKATIHVDGGSRNDKRLLHFLRLIKSDPLTAKLRVGPVVQSPFYFNWKNPENGGHGYHDLLDMYIPEIAENYQTFEKYYFTDYDITPDRSKLWFRAVTTSRLAIDVPGVTNRIIGLDIFNRGGGGYFMCETMIWESSEGDNPWENPYTRFGNGACSYFYPPRKDGPSKKPDYTIIPSLRVMTFRESVEDYDYAIILEELIAIGRNKGVDVSKGEAAIKDIERFFYSSVHWSQNDAWYLDLRDRMARAIVELKEKMNKHNKELNI